MTTYDFLGSEAISHLNSVKGIIGHLEERTRAGDTEARRVLEGLGITLRSFSFSGSPATGKNLNPKDGPSQLQGSPESNPGLNYFAPKRILLDLLEMEWFDKVCIDKKRFTMQWRNQLMEDLMASEHRDKIAKDWANKDLRLQVKGHIMGALAAAGVFKERALAIARIYYGTGALNTKEVKTLAKYMGDSRKEYYREWVIKYVKQH